MRGMLVGIPVGAELEPDAVVITLVSALLNVVGANTMLVGTVKEVAESVPDGMIEYGAGDEMLEVLVGVEVSAAVTETELAVVLAATVLDATVLGW